MTNKTLSKPALQIINDYLNLSIADKKIKTPYFNNRRNKIRGGLRVLIGTGSPKDIVEETTILSLREKADISNLNEEDLQKYLVEHNLGIDCSGLVYHVLDAELKSRNKGSLYKYIRRPWIKNPLRKLIAKLRTVENAGVSTFNNPANSKEIEVKDIQPGDMIIMMNTGRDNNIHHILLVYETKTENSELRTMNYVHSFQYPEDGKYNHGVRQESVEITNTNKTLLEQNWSEPRMLEHARQAKEFKIARIKTLK